MRYKIWIWGILLFQFVILLAFTARSLLPWLNGRTVTLQVKPMDPRDIFRHNYMLLNYDLNQFQLDSIPNDLSKEETYHYGDVLYIELCQEEKYSRPCKIWKKLPANSNMVFIKGIVQKEFRYNVEDPYELLLVNYGIESYYTQNSTIRRIERNYRPPEDTLNVSILIDSYGNARIKEINPLKKRKN
ncbi:GDYXXLXY domain-containing protein [Xanthovirga aplysinae]|uniref:GDYXXLXY domain-containing protein n=1 Tax=Xanthovirga aplysinae TaxID=2529853 RepID=UPI0012BD21AD|nr:GDYXXLXY domain-containing protein [Xanthovirga aplysinae]MTI29716.1 hypothetical protein [Xanthovirga aplysinae]